MLPSRSVLFLALMLASVAVTGCPRTVRVHIDASELSRAKPILIGQGERRAVLETSRGEELQLDRVGATGWTSDNGSRWSSVSPWLLYELAHGPNAKPHPFYPPQGGTWTLEQPDDTTLSTVGRVTTLVGAGASGLVLAAFVMTGIAIGPQSDVDPQKVFLIEGIAGLSSASIALVGGVLWVAGSARFRSKQTDLGRGTFRW